MYYPPQVPPPPSRFPSIAIGVLALVLALTVVGVMSFTVVALLARGHDMQRERAACIAAGEREKVPVRYIPADRRCEGRGVLGIPVPMDTVGW